MRFFIIPDFENKSTLVIHPEAARLLGLEKKRLGILRFGSRACKIEVVISKQLAPDELQVANKVIEYLHLPLSSHYEVRVNGNEIILGPFIGILSEIKEENITPHQLKVMLKYLHYYHQVNGAIIAFSLEGMNREEQLIKGYCYDPVENEWKAGTYPYPVAIFRRTAVSKKWMKYLVSVFGDKIFNSDYFNKWEMYEWLEVYPQISKHLPQTILYKRPEDIHTFLQKYGKAYIKPLASRMGIGVMQVSTRGNEYVLKFRDKNEGPEKGKSRTMEFLEINKLNGVFQNRLVQEEYIIQQPIDILKHNDSVIDFRLIMQRNEFGHWFFVGMVARFGVKGSVVSNISTGGQAMRGEEALQKILLLSEKGVFVLKDKMVNFATTVCERLGECGVNCGDLGVDLALDKEGHIWLIEVNNRFPDPTIALDIDDQAMYYAAKTAPMLYAKKLAGFSPQRGEN